MAETLGPCPVHTLLEDIQDGSLFVYPMKKRLRDLDPRQVPTAAEIHTDAGQMKSAHVFDFSAFPSDTVHLSKELWDTGDDISTRGMAHLPYSNVIFCRRVKGRLHDLGEGISDFVLTASLWLDPEEVTPTPLIGVRGYQRFVGKTRWRFNGHTMLFGEGGCFPQWLDDPETYGLDELFQWSMTGGTESLFLSGLAALSSKGPEIRTLAAPEKLNKQRAKKGKPPVFEYRIVDIPAWALAKADGLGGTHASPRLHWRRGHERRIGEGRKTFVHAHLVGCADRGFIHKDYAVAPEVSPTDT